MDTGNVSIDVMAETLQKYLFDNRNKSRVEMVKLLVDHDAVIHKEMLEYCINYKLPEILIILAEDGNDSWTLQPMKPNK